MHLKAIDETRTIDTRQAVQDCAPSGANSDRSAQSGIITIDWTKPPARKFREVIQPAFASSQRRIRPIRAERRAGLIRAIARGRQWLNEIVAGTTSIDGLAQRQNCSLRQINMTLSMAFIAPAIVKAAIEGRLPRGIGIAQLRDVPPLMSPAPQKPKGAIKLYRGVSIYQVEGSQNWYVRVWNRERQRYIVKTTGVRTAVKAREIAKEFALELLKTERAVDREFTFRHFAIKCLSQSSRLVGKGERNTDYARVIKWAIQNEDWGLVRHFGTKDVRTLKTHDFRTYIENLSRKRPHLSPSTKNTILAAFRNVLKVARDEGVIERVPDTPRTKQHDNPRPFFRFHPLVSKKDDAYKKVLDTAAAMAKEEVVVRGVPVTDELYDVILFLTHSFVRPIVTELYAIKHSDITVADNPKRLIVIVRDGKTGFRAANTMFGAVPVYGRIQKRYPDAKLEDYIFLPQYENRQTASRVIQRQFHELLVRTGFDKDPTTQSAHTLYSLRHTAICMRIILSEGQVNIFNLAKNAGTSVDQIERFYARNLPLSKEMARNLQSFGSG